MTRDPTTYTYKTVGDCHIKADVYGQPDAVAPSPTIVYIYWGCLIYGSRVLINLRQLELYLIAGYTVVSIDYRLAPETKLPGIIAFLRDTFRWASSSGPDQFSVDPQRIGAVGHPAGGYLALMSS